MSYYDWIESFFASGIEDAAESGKKEIYRFIATVPIQNVVKGESL